MKRQFNIKYKESVQNKVMRVETRDGRKARIVSWDKYDIFGRCVVAFVQVSNVEEKIMEYYPDGRHCVKFESDWDLFLVDDKDDVLSFIQNFQNEGTIETFMNGCCYWFADILLQRFTILDNHVGNIYYNQILGHFATWIDGKLYDITGEIEKTDDWVPWLKWVANEPTYGQVVVRDCILKKDTEQ